MADPRDDTPRAAFVSSGPAPTMTLLVPATLLALALGACSPSTPPEPPAPVADGSPLAQVLRQVAASRVETLDLTHPLSADGLYWPTGTPFEHRRLDWGRTPGGFWYASAEFAAPEHLGTHLDAPIHFAEQGWTAAEIPLERLMAPGALIDISARAATADDATLEPSDLDRWEQAHGPMSPGAIVIVRTGWSERWPDWNRYYGSATPKDVATLHFPGVSAEAAKALVARGVAGVGIDTASIDPGVSRTFEAHQVLAAANILNLENLTNVATLPGRGFAVIALPMKIEGGTGGPARVVALVAR
jgi:kynurenine formamidase